MTIFSDNPYDRRMERLMTTVPNFKPRGVGFRFAEPQIFFAYCIIKIFFQNIKRGGILLVQMSVGALYMFSVPRGYADGFNQWCKQVIAICLTAFMQTTLLFLGLLTFPQNMLLGLGIMLAANEVPRIAQQYGLQKGNHRKIKGLSALFIRIKRKYIASGSNQAATAVCFCSQPL